MLSRVANSIYWTNRYMERVENYARFVAVNLNLALDLPPNVEEQWDPLLVATADHSNFYRYYDSPTREDVIYFMTFDRRNPNSIVSCLQAARENARTIRETISREMWESINSLHLQLLQFSKTKSSAPLDKIQDFFDSIKTNCLLYHGIVDSTFTRNEAWHFGRLGRYLERADKSSRFLDVKYFTLVQDSENTNYTLELMISSAVLKSVSAYNMFRQTHKALNRSNIASFLILDRYFPRAIVYSLLQAEMSLYAIGGSSPAQGAGNMAEKKLSKLRSDMEYSGGEEIFKNSLHHYLDQFQTRNNEVDSTIFNTYFGLKPTRDQLMQHQVQSRQA
jgi:uncharacterized alpha-E superfamily protein